MKKQTPQDKLTAIASLQVIEAYERNAGANLREESRIYEKNANKLRWSQNLMLPFLLLEMVLAVISMASFGRPSFAQTIATVIILIMLPSGLLMLYIGKLNTRKFNAESKIVSFEKALWNVTTDRDWPERPPQATLASIKREVATMALDVLHAEEQQEFLFQHGMFRTSEHARKTGEMVMRARHILDNTIKELPTFGIKLTKREAFQEAEQLQQRLLKKPD